MGKWGISKCWFFGKEMSDKISRKASSYTGGLEMLNFWGKESTKQIIFLENGRMIMLEKGSNFVGQYCTPTRNL